MLLKYPSKQQWYILAIFVFFFCYSLIQFLGQRPDQSIRMRSAPEHLYLAQQVASGAALYTELAWNKTPLSIYINALCFMLCHGQLVPAVLLVRFVYWGIILLGAWPLYVLAKGLFKEFYLGLGPVFLYLGFPFVYNHIAGEPDWHILMSSLGLYALAFAVRGQFLFAGMCAALAFLSWQPGIVFFAAIFLAGILSAPGSRQRNIKQAITGFALPVLIISGYLLARGSLNDFIQLAFVSVQKNIALGFLEGLRRIPQYARLCYSPYSLVIVSSLLGFILHAFYMLKSMKTRDDNKAHLLVFTTTSLTILYSVLDFQHCDDFLPFIPWVSLYAVYPVKYALGIKSKIFSRYLAPALAVALAWAFIGASVCPVTAMANITRQPIAAVLLQQQDDFYRQLHEYGFQEHDQVVCIESALPCLLTGKKNVYNKFLFLFDDYYTAYIREHEPERVEHLFRALREGKPKFVFLMADLLEKRRYHAWAVELQTILAQNYKKYEQGRLNVYLRKEGQGQNDN